MAGTFLHGVEVLEIDSGTRPIQTVNSAVIGLIGTAPGAAAAVAATLAIGAATLNSALTFTAAEGGVAGNNITVEIVAATEADTPLAVAAVGRAITITLGTDSDGDATGTAAEVATAVRGNVIASGLVAVTNTGASTGLGNVLPMAKTALSGGVDEPFPLNKPVMVAGSRTLAAKLGADGTLPDAIDSIFDQVGAAVIVVRVAEGTSDATTLGNVIGGVDGTTGAYTGVQAFLGAESVLGFVPRILIAPGFTHQRENGNANGVVAELVGIAERLRAIIVADGPNTTDEAAVAYAGDFGSPRVYLIDPWVLKVNSDGATYSAPASPCVAGLIAKSDNDRGFWWSPSNQTINGIVGTSRPVDFSLGDSNSRANLLNSQNVATIIHQDGYRLWGNRTLSSDPKWAFLSVRRTADIINDSLLRAHLWAVDRNITKTYVEDVTDGVNDYLRLLVGQGAILGGNCWADPDLNTAAAIANGEIYFNFDFTAPSPAEHIVFRSMATNDYISEIF